MFIELNPKTEKEWKELRSKVLTASDIGVILGLNPWKSVKDLDSSNEVPDNYAMWLGRQLEPVVVAAVNRRLNSNFILYEQLGVRSFFVDSELGLGATPDACDNFILLEAKTTKERNYLRWFDNPPLYYVSQLYTQMLCCDKPEGILAIMSKNLDKEDVEMEIYKINRSQWFDDIILKEVKRYWECKAKNKQYRVDRTQTRMIQLKLKIELRRLT